MHIKAAAVRYSRVVEIENCNRTETDVELRSDEYVCC